MALIPKKRLLTFKLPFWRGISEEGNERCINNLDQCGYNTGPRKKSRYIHNAHYTANEVGSSRIVNGHCLMYFNGMLYFEIGRIK